MLVIHFVVLTFCISIVSSNLAVMESSNNKETPAVPVHFTESSDSRGALPNEGVNVDPTPSTSTAAPTGTASTSSRLAEAHTGAVKKKREEKKSKRDQRSWENMFKAISSLPEPEKLEIIKQKYTDLYNDYKTTLSYHKNMEKQVKTLQKEKEQIQSDLTKNILSRSKLENLARELQKQNKDIKEENYNRLKEEEEKRKEVAANFTENLNTLTQLMDENKDKSIRLRDENINMTTKLTELYDQFQERETHLANMNRQMELQKKLSDTQMKKMEFEFQSEREMWKNERIMLISNLEKSDQANKVLQENVNSLQEHLNSYQKQYADFEATMKRSNKVLDSFKEEMANMHKTSSVLEKERKEWKTRYKQSTQKCASLSEAQIKATDELQLTQKKLEALEKLCRKLTAERSYYLQQLKLRNITPITPVEEEGSTGSNSTSASLPPPVHSPHTAIPPTEDANVTRHIPEITEGVPALLSLNPTTALLYSNEGHSNTESSPRSTGSMDSYMLIAPTPSPLLGLEEQADEASNKNFLDLDLETPSQTVLDIPLDVHPSEMPSTSQTNPGVSPLTNIAAILVQQKHPKTEKEEDENKKESKDDKEEAKA